MQATKPRKRQALAIIGGQTCLYYWSRRTVGLALWRVDMDAANPDHPLDADAAEWLRGVIVKVEEHASDE